MSRSSDELATFRRKIQGLSVFDSEAARLDSCMNVH
jgi:hypothetical protein